MDISLPITLADRFSAVLMGLCGMVAARGGRDHAAAPMVVLVWSRLRRMVTRFLALKARVDARVAATADTVPQAGPRATTPT